MQGANVLSIECATEVCSVAVTCGAQCWQVENRTLEKHSQTIFPMVSEVLRASSITSSDLSLIAVGIGPGSFTGVRTAVSVAQGLAFGWGKPLIGVNTLHALVRCASITSRQRVLAAMDARMYELYVSILDVFDGVCVEVQSAAVMQPARIRDWLSSPIDAVVGYGLDEFRQQLETYGVPIELAEPSARHIGQLGLQLFMQGAETEPQRCQPLYVRNQVALTTAQRAQLERAA